MVAMNALKTSRRTLVALITVLFCLSGSWGFSTAEEAEESKREAKKSFETVFSSEVNAEGFNIFAVSQRRPPMPPDLTEYGYTLTIPDWYDKLMRGVVLFFVVGTIISICCNIISRFW